MTKILVMRTQVLLALILAVMLGACTRDDDADARPPFSQPELSGYEFGFKVKAEDWEAQGTPGDDTQGYSAISEVYLLTEEIIQNGTVRVYVKRGINNWAELPMQASQNAPHGVNWRFTCRAGSVQVLMDRNGESFDPPGELMVFKVVVFPG